MLRRQRAIEIVPSSKSLRWRRYDVPQHLAPKTSDALRFRAVEGDLELLNRRHRSTIGEGARQMTLNPTEIRRRRGYRPEDSALCAAEGRSRPGATRTWSFRTRCPRLSRVCDL